MSSSRVVKMTDAESGSSTPRPAAKSGSSTPKPGPKTDAEFYSFDYTREGYVENMQEAQRHFPESRKEKK
ncbi:hypothetical protein LTR95_009662 [Oleoguttula sp. CCFEE 5521]